jgi:predicted metalloprotease with PDZ domain
MTNIARIEFARAALLFVTVAACSDAVATERDSTTHYEITIPADDHRSAHVRVSLVPHDPEFYMFPGADQLPARWSTFVSDFRVRDEQDQPVPLVAHDDGTWRLSNLPPGRITVSYTVNLDHEDHEWSGGIDGAAYWREWGVFYTARSLFVVNGKERENIAISFDLPARWQVTAPWPDQGGDRTRFVVARQDLLATSMFFAGTHREVTVREGPFEFLLALGGEEVLALEDLFVDMAEGVLDYYVELMGDVPRLRSRDAAGRPVVIINQAEMTDGEAIGNNISILLGPSDNPMSQQIAQLLFAHEFFHLWNGKSFFPSGEDGEWFKEGFSNFYTLKALHHIGYLDDDALLGVLGGFFYPRYEQDNAVGRLSMTNGDLKHEHWGLIYSGGMLVAMAQDLKIRAATGNNRSLDDLMRFMFEEFGDEPYGIADIERELGTLNNASQKDFFDRYVRGTDRIDISEFLALADIETMEVDGRTVFRISDNRDPDRKQIRSGFFGQ